MTTRDRHIALWLLWVSLLMQVVPVFPHHHHGAHAAICLRHDMVHDDDALPESENDCEHTGCVASLFAFNPADADHHVLPAPWQQVVADVRQGLLPTPSATDVTPIHTPYLISLRSDVPIASFALRAPPCMLVA